MLDKAPNIWTLEQLVKSAETIHAGFNGKWVPVRPLGFDSLKSRLQLAWTVFTGKGDVVIWPENQ